MNDNNDAYNNNQFVVSYELLALLRWLIEHDGEKIKKIITKAYASGLKNEIRKVQNHQDMSLEDIHFTILEFLGLMDSLLTELTNEQIAQQALEQNLMPAIEHLDTTVCDDDMVRSSMEKATIGNTLQENPKTVLYRELLKRWKPTKKNAIN